LHGGLRISLRISLVVTGWNADSMEDGRLRISGGLAVAVAVRIVLTLLVKYFHVENHDQIK